jgi:hypothetical protein
MKAGRSAPVSGAATRKNTGPQFWNQQRRITEQAVGASPPETGRTAAK